MTVHEYWHEPLLRTAFLLYGKRATRILAAVLCRHQDVRQAHIALYRRYLRWPAASRAQRAFDVAHFHDRRSEAEIADLLGWSIERVRTMTGTAPAVPPADDVPDPGELLRRIRRRRVLRRALLITPAVLLLPAIGGVMLWGHLAALHDREQLIVQERAHQRTLPDRFQEIAFMPSSGVAPVKYAYQDPGPGLDGPAAQWYVITETRKWRLKDALREQGLMAITPDGRKLAYYSLSRGRMVIHDVTNGQIVPASATFAKRRLNVMDAYTSMAFSLDGRHLAFQLDAIPKQDLKASGVIVTDTTTGRIVDLPAKDLTLAGWAREGVVITGDRPGRVIRPDRTVVAKIAQGIGEENDVVSPDGRLVAHGLTDEWTKSFTLLDSRTGKTVREVQPQLTKGMQLEFLHAWLDDTHLVISAAGQEPVTSYHLVDITTGTTRPLITEDLGVPYSLILGKLR
ncbi:hypothetical protein [Nonomuraea endophytica]|uniref:WD40 repeat domain-containing protein n=1 Tax=Nonomuraea endophytica TaxID=714136 RepID=A0A7W8A4P0_9ACTN|nr:hypothetical protein [Nonomuraea endophytica]MBB5079531.1 hypothetical protein [Nonomuraea endophytica]